MPEHDSPSIRTVNLEFLRKGPPHNQLLSPLTEYLGICGDAGAGSVSVPYEQSAFDAVLEALHYNFDEEDQAPRQRALRTLGRDIGEVLGSVPGFTGSLVEHESGGALLNLRIIASASELARLPFELAKMPSGSGRSTNDWLALQSATPVCITRRSRTVQTHCAYWCRNSRPRVLFIVGLDIDQELAENHREVLMNALAPWDTFRDDGKSHSAHCLVEMSPFRGKRPTVDAIRSELASSKQAGSHFDYVHILAHGAESTDAEALTYGLYLPGPKPSPNESSAYADEDVSDVVTGDRFASMLASIPRDNWPSVIFTATCDSANQGNLLIPGGNFAQALHEAGVPLVVASQFPLTTEGSVTLTRALYGDLFWGCEPLPSLARARAKLHADYSHTHDWASLVIYDGTRDNFYAQILACRYERSKKALGHAQDVMRQITPQEDTRIKDPLALANDALERLPNEGGYERELEGLIASHAKLMATTAYEQGKTENDEKTRRERFRQSRAHLEQARRHYYKAARGFLDPGNAKQLQATLHWVLTQALSLDRLLGNSPIDLGWDKADVEAFGTAPEQQMWDLAFQSATVATQSEDNAIWGHGSLAELWLLKLFENLTDAGIERARTNAARHAMRMAQLSVGPDAFPVYSTKRQIRRYTEAWTTDFRDDLELDPPEETLGLASPSTEQQKQWTDVQEAARELVKLLSLFDTKLED